MSEHLDQHGQGAVVVDIGGDVGALVLITDAGLAGAEIVISATGHPDRRTHVAVLARPVGSEVRHAAVFPALREGGYLLWPPDGGGGPLGPVAVVGGRVTEVHWSDLVDGT